MGFLAPWMLFGAIAAAIPIILHFFYRSRFRDVPWAAMKFLLAAIEQTSRRLKFQELLLLLLRVRPSAASTCGTIDWTPIETRFTPAPTNVSNIASVTSSGLHSTVTSAPGASGMARSTAAFAPLRARAVRVRSTTTKSSGCGAPSGKKRSTNSQT